MNDQPIIIEERAHKAISETIGIFWAFRRATAIRQKYRQAMLSIAAVRFNQPHAINLAAHKCLPAFLKISPEGKLIYEYDSFTNPVVPEEVYPDELEEQEKNEQACLQKQQVLSSCEDLTQRQQICEGELLRRFNVVSQQETVLQISKQFKEVIELLLELDSFESYIKRTEDKRE